MAQDFEIRDAFQREFGRDPTGDEISKAKDFSVGQLNDSANLRRVAGVQTADDIARETIRLQQEAVAPAVKSLEASIPETQQRYQTERERLESKREPLTQRYDNLISEITGRETSQKNSATLRTSNELGRRGISSDSGVYEQELSRVLDPIINEYSTILKDANLSREDSLQNLDDLIASLTGQETQAIRDVRNTIGQLQAGAGQAGIENAFSQLALKESSRQKDLDRQLTELLSGSDQTAQQLLEILNIGGTGYAVDPLTGQVINSFGGGGGGTSSSTRPSLSDIFA